ncbi:hypothetical protein BT96DRAFT_1012319 [Gymnopus androsaceus JB14]|uniref:Uncharacterized protein n=1 Tax=Gymnopus androsaceus JB14 TaxID=1447944 RepID=A0A6A4IKG9_9AGAR|nr:hypothetical protein BT96DRAFT_1012319 [Gymnopus androsaceus JB14]
MSSAHSLHSRKCSDVFSSFVYREISRRTIPTAPPENRRPLIGTHPASYINKVSPQLVWQDNDICDEGCRSTMPVTYHISTSLPEAIRPRRAHPSVSISSEGYMNEFILGCEIFIIGPSLMALEKDFSDLWNLR